MDTLSSKIGYKNTSGVNWSSSIMIEQIKAFFDFKNFLYGYVLIGPIIGIETC